MAQADDLIPIPTLTDSMAKELGARPVSEGLTADVSALHALALYDAYLSLPQDRGGPNGPKGRAHQAWLDAKDAALSAPAVTSPPKAEEEPVAWFRNSQQNPKMWYQVETHELKHYRERGCTLLPLLPLLPRPNPVSAELVEAGKAVEAAITAFANMALLAVPADHNPTVRAVLGEGLYNARERLRAALSAHAGEAK